MIDLKFERVQEIVLRTGRKRSTFYDRIKAGLWTPGVSLGLNSSAWPAHETDALLAAVLAGKSDDEIRALVKQLIAMRTELLADVLGALSSKAVL